MIFDKWINAPDPIDNYCENKQVIGVREWMATVMLMALPIVNIVILLRWAFADKSTTPASKVNWARGSLIVMFYIFVAILIIVLLFYIFERLHKPQ